MVSVAAEVAVPAATRTELAAGGAMVGRLPVVPVFSVSDACKKALEGTAKPGVAVPVPVAVGMGVGSIKWSSTPSGLVLQL